MRITRTFILLVFLSQANWTFCQQAFLNELGIEKAQSFQNLIDSYRNFLDLNYSNTATLGEQTRKFMMQMVNGETITYDSLDALNLIRDLEESGLRQDIYLYSNETYEPTYNLRQFLSEEQADEIDDVIALTNREFIVNDSLKHNWDSIFQVRFSQLPPEKRRIHQELERKQEERIRWTTDTNPKGLYHYALLKTDTSFYSYCLIRTELLPGITPALTELSTQELEAWNIQILFMVDYYLTNILFQYRRYMVKDVNRR